MENILIVGAKIELSDIQVQAILYGVPCMILWLSAFYYETITKGHLYWSERTKRIIGVILWLLAVILTYKVFTI